MEGQKYSASCKYVVVSGIYTIEMSNHFMANAVIF